MEFSLAVSINSPYVILIFMDIAFATDGDKLCLPITEFLLHAAAGNLARPKKQRDWTPRNSVRLPPFLTEAAIINGGWTLGIS